jgi:hypothetical protein
MHNPAAFCACILDRNDKVIYGPEHPMTIAFQGSVKNLQGGKSSDEQITSTFRIPLKFQVKEQFHELGGHPGIVWVEYDDHKMMTVFMMGVRDYYLAPSYANATFRKFQSPGRPPHANTVAVNGSGGSISSANCS